MFVILKEYMTAKVEMHSYLMKSESLTPKKNKGQKNCLTVR